MFRLSGLKRGGLHISLLTCSKLALIHESFSWNHGLEKSNIIRYFDIHSGQISPEYFPKMSKENGLVKTYFLSKPEVLDFVLLKYYHFPHKNPQNSGYHCKTPKYLWSELTLNWITQGSFTPEITNRYVNCGNFPFGATVIAQNKGPPNIRFPQFQ